MSKIAANILILDPDYDYASRLVRQINLQKAYPFKAFYASNSKAALQSLKQKLSYDLIILAEDFVAIPQLKHELETYTTLVKTKKRKAFQPKLIYPGQRQEEVLARIAECLAQAAPGGVSSKPLILCYSFNPRLRRQWLGGFLQEYKQSGRPLYYFPFLPAYEVSLALEFAPGPELSSFLLLLSSGGHADYAGLGPCFQMQHEGYYALHCGGRAEDIMDLNLAQQSQLMELFRKFIRSRSENSLGLVELGSLPMSNLRNLAGLADIFVAEIPRAKDYAARAARRELEFILNTLPSEVHFQEMNPYEFSLPGQERLRA